MRNPVQRWGVPLVGCLLLVAACGELGNSSKEAGNIGFGRELNEWTDPSTGCVYYIYRSGWGSASTGGITAKLRDDGTPKCSGNEPSKEEVVISP